MLFWVKQVYVPIRKTTRSSHGLSELQLRERLERQGWIVWRGGALNILKQPDVYPNVRRKYERLLSLLRNHDFYASQYLQYLCAVHRGMPDFICYRNGEFKFVECKLSNESLSLRQKRCIPKLQWLGFKVEVHKLVYNKTKTRASIVNMVTGEKRILERQITIRLRPKRNR